jgi:hypothetical protein
VFFTAQRRSVFDGLKYNLLLRGQTLRFTFKIKVIERFFVFEANTHASKDACAPVLKFLSAEMFPLHTKIIEKKV